MQVLGDLSSPRTDVLCHRERTCRQSGVLPGCSGAGPVNLSDNIPQGPQNPTAIARALSTFTAQKTPLREPRTAFPARMQRFLCAPSRMEEIILQGEMINDSGTMTGGGGKPRGGRMRLGSGASKPVDQRAAAAELEAAEKQEHASAQVWLVLPQQRERMSRTVTVHYVVPFIRVFDSAVQVHPHSDA